MSWHCTCLRPGPNLENNVTSSITITHLTTVIGRRSMPSRERNSTNRIGDTIDMLLDDPTPIPAPAVARAAQRTSGAR